MLGILQWTRQSSNTAHFLLARNFDADRVHLLVYGNGKDYPNVTQFTSGVFSFRNGKQTEGFWNYHAV
jgi:hypothetical protein